MTVPTLFFKIVYVLVIISHDRRVIKHIAVTTHPTADWATQQLREATPFGEQLKYIIHDNDPVFRSAAVQQFLAAINTESVRTGYKRPDQKDYASYYTSLVLFAVSLFFLCFHFSGTLFGSYSYRHSCLSL